MIRDESRKCVVAYVNPSRCCVARFLAKLGMETCKKLYTFYRPVGGVEELLDWDQGTGLHHPDFIDIMVSFQAPDPVDFNVSVPLVEQVNDVGLGQINAPKVARMEMDIDEMNDQIKDAVEDSFIGSFGPKGSLWAHEPPLGEMD